MKKELKEEEKLSETTTEPNLIRLSPSGIKSFENCRAGYLFSKVIFPKADTRKGMETTNTGKLFHTFAEHAFSEEAEKDLLVYENQKTVDVIQDFAAILKTRDYYGFPNEKEESLQVTIAGIGKLVGIPDRIVVLDDGWHLIVDYKTSVFCYPDVDKRQVLSYAYLLWKAKGIDPNKIQIVLDYVRADEVFRYTLVKADLERHENYLMSRFRAVKKLLDDFERHQDISKVSHTPGDCNLCLMNGTCLPYHVYHNPHFDPIHPVEMSTEDLIREKLEREDFRKINDERIKAVSRALVERYRSDMKEVIGGELKTPRELIDEFMTKVQQTVEVYDTLQVLTRFVSSRASKMIKGSPFQETVDTQYLEKEIVGFMLEILPAKLGRESVPEDLRKVLEEYKQKQARAPFLRVK